jgi:predicted DNA-binding transcriptional regulator YafY
LSVSDLTLRLDRLERLRGLLASGDAVLSKDIAAELGVSLRTLTRDLGLLRQQGMLIDADRGRGGGVRMASGQRPGRVELAGVEAIDVLISLAIAEKLQPPELSAALRRIRQKLALAFAPAHRERIASLRRRILIGAAASLPVLSSYVLGGAKRIESVRLAFFEMRVLDIRYSDGHGRSTQRMIEPHYLYLNAPLWYVLAWDRLRQDVRMFRIDRMTDALVTDERFSRRNAVAFLAAVTISGAPNTKPVGRNKRSALRRIWRKPA